MTIPANDSLTICHVQKTVQIALTAIATTFDTTARVLGVCRDALIDEDRACAEAVSSKFCFLKVLGKDGRGKSIIGLVRQIYSIFARIYLKQVEDWAEELAPISLRVRVHAFSNHDVGKGTIAELRIFHAEVCTTVNKLGAALTLSSYNLLDQDVSLLD